MKRKVRILLGVLLFLCAIAGYDLYRNNLRCQTEIALTQYILDTNLTQEIRIVHLTDLHGHSFGDDNDTLVNLVLDQNPDLVCMTGDMVDRSSKNPDVILDLIRKLSDQVPVYYGYGNHERNHMAATPSTPPSTSLTITPSATPLSLHHRIHHPHPEHLSPTARASLHSHTDFVRTVIL